MTGDSRLSARFGADTNDFKSGISAINRELRLVESEFRATASTMGDWANDATGLEARMEALNKQIDLQREKVEALRVKHEQMATANGINSVEAQNAQIEFNREAEKLGKLQTELGQTELSLKSMKGESGKVRGAVKDLGKQFDSLKQQVPALGTAFNLLTNPISLAVAGIGAFAVAAKKSIKETVDYNKTVREMTQVTGQSADTISRIIQVGDDWGIEIGSMRGAMELMNKKGYAPSIDNLAKMADEYVNATDKSAFMEEATKKYGKSFGDLIPILAKGGDALRKQAAAVNDNMIATEKSMKAAREYEVAMDDLGDAFQVVKYELGNALLPTVIDLINKLNWLITTTDNAADVSDDLRNAHKRGLITDKELALVLRGLRTGTISYADAIEYLAKITAGETKAEIEENKLLAARQSALDANKKATNDLADSTDDLVAAELAAKIAEDKLNQAYDDLNSAIDGRLGPAEEDFISTQDELKTKMREAQVEIDKAIAKYGPMSEEVLGLKSDYGELETQYDENATAHEEATKRILFGILEQRLSLGTLTDDEEKLLERISVAWGLVDQATVDVMDRYDEAGKYLASHKGDWDNAEKIINGQETAWSLAKKEARLAHEAVSSYRDTLNEIDGKVVTTHIKTIYEEEGRSYPLPGGAQHGANFIVPTGYDNDGYPMRVSSGEHVIVIPPGERFGNLVATLQQLMIQSIKGLNVPASPIVSGGGRIGNQLQPASAPIYITIQGTPEKEMDKRRQARYLAEEIQRRQS